MNQTTLIIGAGVNKEIDNRIGLGVELMQDISDRVTDRTSPNNKYLSELLNDKLKITESVREKFVTDLDRYKAYPEYASIDDFLHKVETLSEFKNQKDEYKKIIKISIIFHILGYEGGSKENIIIDIKNQKTWFSLLCDYIQKNVLESTNTRISIVTFNYDRILEQYLLERFRGNENILKFINNNIYHVYGRIGALENLDLRIFESTKEKIVPFGLDNNKIHTIDEIQNQINLIYEERHVDPRIKEIVKISNELLLLGYGFDYTNNIKIGLDSLSDKPDVKISIYPTSKSIPDRKNIENKINFFLIAQLLNMEVALNSSIIILNYKGFHRL